MHIYICINTWRSRFGERFCYNISDHHVKSDTEQCCNNWRICILNDPIEQRGLILDKIKFQTWGPIYVMDCWPLEVDLKETNKFLFIAFRVSYLWISLTGVNISRNNSGSIPFTYLYMNMLIAWKNIFYRKNIKFQIQVISTSARRYTSNDPYCFVLQGQDMF